MKTPHQQMVAALVKPGDKILSEMSPRDANLCHLVMGIAGESGELVDAIKKPVIYRKEFDMENIIEELGDLEFFMEAIRNEFGITREQTLEANMVKLGKRYPMYNYSNHLAQSRLDKI